MAKKQVDSDGTYYECSICKNRYPNDPRLVEAPYCSGDTGTHLKQMKLIKPKEES